MHNPMIKTLKNIEKKFLNGILTLTNLPNPSSRTMALGVYSTSNRNENQIFLAVKSGRSARLTTAICEPIV
jgi:hypothetical protein